MWHALIFKKDAKDINYFSNSIERFIQCFCFFVIRFFLKKRIYLVVNIKQNLFSTCLLLKVTKKQFLFYVIPRAHDNTRSRAKSATYIGITYIQNIFWIQNETFKFRQFLKVNLLPTGFAVNFIDNIWCKFKALRRDWCGYFGVHRLISRQSLLFKRIDS